jgi:hypothetical protein
MKFSNFFFSLFFLFISQSAFSQDAEVMMKRILQGRINDIFHKWDDQWSWDTYIDESAYITTLKESEYSNDRLVAEGTFTVKRFGSKVKVKFTAKVKATSTSLIITNLCYDDTSASDKDCCEPSKWNLDVISQ